MICKHCGAEMSSSANKCKRCGTRPPAKSSCGGFYDLASAGKKLWENEKSAAPVSTSYSGAPTVRVVKDTRSIMIYQLIALGMAFLLLITLIVSCASGSSKNKEIRRLQAGQQAPTVATNDPEPEAIPSLADCNVVYELALGEDGSVITTDIQITTPAQEVINGWASPAFPYAGSLNVSWSWLEYQPIPEPEVETPEAETPAEGTKNNSESAPETVTEDTTETPAPVEPEVEIPANPLVSILVSISLDEAVFGETSGSEPVFIWEYKKVNTSGVGNILNKEANWSAVADEETGKKGFYLDESGMLVCDTENENVYEYEFRLVYLRDSSQGGSLTIELGSFRCPTPVADNTESAPQDTND